MAVCRLKPVKGCTKAIPEFLMKWIGLLGKKVARYPGWFIAVSIAVAAGFATGLQRMKYLTDIEELFIPTLARGIQERQIVEDNFNMDYQDYVQGHETRYLSQVSFIIMTKNFSQDSLSQHLGLLNQGKEIDGALRKLVVKTISKENVTFEDVCAKSRRSGGQKCQENGILELSSLKYLNTYPTYKHPITKEVIVVPAFLGNISLNDENTALVEDASVLRLFYILDESKKNVKAWEKMALQFIENNNELLDDRYEIFAINSKSLERELTENMHNALGILPVSVGILVCFITMNGLVLTEWKPLLVIR